MRAFSLALGLLLGLNISLAQTTTPPQSAPQPKPNEQAAPNKLKKPDPATQKPPQNKYLVEVHQIPRYCYDKSKGSLDLVNPDNPAPAPPSGCPASQQLIQAQNAADIAKGLGKNDSDFEVQASGSDNILIYGNAKDFKSINPDRLAKLEENADKLAKPPFEHAKVLEVPPGTASDIASQITALKIAGVSSDALGSDQVVVKTDHPVGPIDIDDLERRIKEIQWARPTAPPVQRLFHITTAEVLSGLKSDSSSGGTSKSADSSGSSDKSSNTSKDSSKSSGGTSDTASATATSNSTSATPSVSVTVNATGSQQSAKPLADSGTAAADTTTDDGSNGKPTASAKVAPSDSSKKPAPSATPLTMQAVRDNLVYSNDDGSDNHIAERTRLITMLDLPRPEVLLNMWSFQVSSPNPETISEESDRVRREVVQHNDLLQQAIDGGWAYLNSRGNDKTFFNKPFYQYVTQKFVLDQAAEDERDPNASPKPHSIELEFWKANRVPWGWCRINTYCLGFAHAFEPLRPTLTNILLTIAAANDPEKEAQETIGHMTGFCKPLLLAPKTECINSSDAIDSPKDSSSEKTGQAMGRALTPCDQMDLKVLNERHKSNTQETLQLYCFAEQARRSFSDGQSTDRKAKETRQGTRVGLLRAAIADFLFNYKMAQQYPHDFVSYDLAQSAQELNAEFNPLILAFNRDVAAFSQHLQSLFENRHLDADTGQWIGDERGTFVNNSLISVRGISGVESIVDTLSQNFFDATEPPNLTDLVKSVSDAEKNIPGVLKANLTSHEAAVIIGALNSVQPAQAKIGRQFKLDIIPHALASASSAELEVNLTNQEAADPTLFKGGKSSEDNLSRVARHNTTTRVRVESLKLFEVSSFAALLEYPRKRFPIIPPFFEVPYFGSFVGIPLPNAKEYHRSTAIVSAVIVPTAADLAYGIDFSGDRTCLNADEDRYGANYNGHYFHCYHNKSFSDFNGLPFRNFHKAMIQCFASNYNHDYTGLLAYTNDSLKDYLAKAKATTPTAANQNVGLDGGTPDTQDPSHCSDLEFQYVPPSD